MYEYVSVFPFWHHLSDISAEALRNSLTVPHTNEITEDRAGDVIEGVLDHLAIQEGLDQETGVVVGEAKMIPPVEEEDHYLAKFVFMRMSTVGNNAQSC